MQGKPIDSVDAAVSLVGEGATLMVGGFGLCGIPENLLKALAARGTRDLTIISNNPGTDDFGVGLLIAGGQVRRLIASYVGENKDVERRVHANDLMVDLVPQGTLAERIRAGGAGVGGFFTPTGYGTVTAEGKEVRLLDGQQQVFERPLTADFAFIKAWKGDTAGNLVYRRTARNFNPVMATAAEVTIAEVEELVEPGEIDPDHVVTPGIFVQHILVGSAYERRIEKRTTRS